MANKREFKKYVDALAASIVDEMVSAYYNVSGVDRDKIAESVKLTLGAVGKAKTNANVCFDKGSKAFEDEVAYAKAKRVFFRALFDKIVTEYNEEINAALKVFNSALPADEKARNKEAAMNAAK